MTIKTLMKQISFVV